MSIKYLFKKEYWSGDSKDGMIINGDGYHFFKMDEAGNIIEAYELYETDDGDEVVTPLPEMHKVNWLKDLGFNDFETLEKIDEHEFFNIKRKVGFS